MDWQLCGKRNAWALGGNRTGKTVGGATKAVLFALGDSVRKYINDWPKEVQKQYEPLIARFKGKTRGWVVSITFEVQRDVAQTEVLKWLPKREILKITHRSKGIIDYIQLKNGSIIGFKSCDQGREKFQGTSQHWIWFDEEPPKEIYDECKMRTMDVEGDIFGTMTPLLGLTWVYDDIYLNDSKPIEKQDKETCCIFMEWDDNPYLSDNEKQRLEASMDTQELEARKHGRFIMPGKGVFDPGAIQNMLDKCYPGERGNLDWADNKTKVKWTPDLQGDYEVWFHPKDDEYLIPADIAEGLEYGDYDAVGVINRDKLRLDAVYHGHIDADVLAEYIHKLAVYYKRPMVVPELNNHGLTTISHLKQDYTDIYRSMVYDKHADEEREKLGWHTNSKTRPLLVDAIKRAVREHQIEIYWRRFADEAMNFIRHPNGKEAARSGYWDDAIIMMGIGVHVHNTVPMIKNIPSPNMPGRKGPKAGWQVDAQGREIFIHPSKIEDMRKQEWGDSDW